VGGMEWTVLVGRMYIVRTGYRLWFGRCLGLHMDDQFARYSDCPVDEQG